MKVISACLLLASASCVDAAQFADGSQSAAVGKVVKMLKNMMKQSQKDWKSDQKAFKTFVGYCETNTEKKTKAIADASTAIGLLSNKIDAVKGSSGALSIETAQLKTDMSDNVASRAEAKAIRQKEEKAFNGEAKDLVASMGQMDEALKILSAIGADQTMASGADHAKFMGKFKKKALLSIGSSMKQALTAASSLLEPEKKTQLASFLQAPFTGTYTAQSGQIVGIFKDMRDTFASNLEEAQSKEKASKKSYLKFKKNKESEHKSLEKSYDEKQASVGTNDGDLSTKKTQLAQSIEQKGEDENFMAKLTVQCADKRKEYENRKLFVANEDAALSKAIAILDNGVAAEKFAAVKATSKGKKAGKKLLNFIQVSKQNHFNRILKQIKKMVKLADDEQATDDHQKVWCLKSRRHNKKELEHEEDSLDKIKSDITKLKADINDPKSGLKMQLSESDSSLKTNINNQRAETLTRRKENIEYQKNVKTMEDSINILGKAEKVLKKYYDTLDNVELGLMQTGAAPTTFEGAYKGQNEVAKKVLGMIASIKAEAWKEEKVAHGDELKDQHEYEDSMKALTAGEESLQMTIVKLNKNLASKQKELLAKREDRSSTQKEVIDVKRYIAKMKPGCDFVLGKYATRKRSRAAERKALIGAHKKLKNTSAFKAAQHQDHMRSLGKCKALCIKDKAHVSCLACLADVSIPGYCAGHKGTKGC